MYYEETPNEPDTLKDYTLSKTKTYSYYEDRRIISNYISYYF